ncbi:MAG: glycosyltransferase family 4 protein [Chloroflexi bacterium]|nr:glycosyltransferase family 4 protein [Chloroflexota bacterium]
MKTILLISRCPPFPLYLGDRLIIWHLARELSRRGYVIDLLALYDRDGDPRQIDEYRPYFRHIELFPEPRRKGIAYLRRLFEPGARFASSAERSFCPPLWRAIAARLSQVEYDLAHCFGSVSVYEYHPLFAHLPNLITPYESHALYLQSAAAQGGVSARLRLPIARRFEAFMFRPYDRTVVISEVDKELLGQLQPGLSLEVIANGIELQRFRPLDIERDPHTLLFVGNYEYAPNQAVARILIDKILPEVRGAIPETRLQLIGNNPPDWLREAGRDHIEVSGHVPDVRPYLARATLFVCPLQAGAGLKNKVLEALAMGIPVLATPLSVDGIDVRHGVSAVIAPVDQIAAKTIEVLRDGALRKQLAENGRALIESQYSWARTASSYERLYDEICRQ